jgi:hypothetical protein
MSLDNPLYRTERFTMGNIKIMPKVRRACVRWSAQIISDVRGPDCGGELRGGNEGSVHGPLTRAPLSSGLSQKQRAGAFAPALIRASQSICCGSVLPRINPLPPWIRAIAGHPKARAKRRCGSGTLRVMPPAISRAAARSAAGGGTASLKSGLWALAWIRTFRARWIVAQTPGRPGRSYQGKRRSGGAQQQRATAGRSYPGACMQTADLNYLLAEIPHRPRAATGSSATGGT